MAGGDEETGGGCCCTTASSFGGVIEPVVDVVGAGGLGLVAGELPALEDEPPEQRPLVLGSGKTRPCAGVL